MTYRVVWGRRHEVGAATTSKRRRDVVVVVPSSSSTCGAPFPRRTAVGCAGPTELPLRLGVCVRAPACACVCEWAVQ